MKPIEDLVRQEGILLGSGVRRDTYSFRGNVIKILNFSHGTNSYKENANLKEFSKYQQIRKSKYKKYVSKTYMLTSGKKVLISEKVIPLKEFLKNTEYSLSDYLLTRHSITVINTLFEINIEKLIDSMQRKFNLSTEIELTSNWGVRKKKNNQYQLVLIDYEW